MIQGDQEFSYKLIFILKHIIQFLESKYIKSFKPEDCRGITHTGGRLPNVSLEKYSQIPADITIHKLTIQRMAIISILSQDWS